ncbi:Hsp20/alpha crystallin family protein [Phormidium sp. CLA17]|uniref:Hsp20/alpha crystallin family protein n=1 Tax=Leptolyngbya sp. Cla-17 TaxID=2803751 RepID=UPI0014911A78|nr:Hsp20/alpha crystallin family protein [Leptolyngbya sp. Cla-17]MBM0742275.1 Hsp20/alpha crystallin family protein [Leptolyngbya sp. Cla-17]
MTLIRWQPWQEVDSLRHQLDQLFDELSPANHGTSLRKNGVNWTPAIELKSTETELVLRIELPGIEAKDMDVQVSREAVSISGKYKAENQTETQKVVFSEFHYGGFKRVISLPNAVQNEQVKAEFKDGILTLTLPKVEADRPKVVKVNLEQA